MKHVIAVTLLLLLSAAGEVAAQDRKAAAPESRAGFDRDRYRIAYEKFVLDNGLTLLVHEDQSVPIVAVNVWYHVGSRNESEGRTGFAHLFEHFFFNGSENHPHGFREAMDDLGANNRNGTTSTDRTNFFEDVPVPALERTLYLEADRMGFLAGNLSPEMLERERGVVKNEKRQGENQPYGRVFSRVVEMIYPAAHPYSWSPIGSMEDLDAATMDDIREWYQTYYGPNNAVIALAGDITPARALELVKKYFDGIPPGPPLTRAEAWVPRLDRNIRDTMQDRVPQARVYRIYHAPAWNDPELQSLDLVAEVLSGSKSGRLDRRLVYEKEIATQISAGVWEKELGSNFLVVATVKEGVDPALVEREIDAVVSELLAKGPTPDELQRAQSRVLSGFLRGAERLGGFGGRSDVLAESMTYGGSPEAYLNRLERVATATPDAVRKSGESWLKANHYTMVVTPFPKLSAGSTTVDRKVLPPLADAPDVAFPDVKEATLSNGLKVMLLERHSVPLVNLALVVDAGSASDPTDRRGLASLALDLMDEGTTTRDTFRIVNELDAVGARLSTHNTLDQSFIRLQAIPMHLRKSLEIFADVVLNPAFPPDMVELQKKRTLSAIAQEKSQPNALARRIAPRLLYGPQHPYGQPWTGSGYESTVQAISRENLSSWHRLWFKPNNGVLVVTGDTTLEQIVPELERALGSWKREHVPVKTVAEVPHTAGGRVYLIDRPGAPQSVIVAAHVSERPGADDELAIETVLRNFGGMATSRLNRNLRLEKHWSYGTSGGLIGARGQRPFIVTAPVQTDRTKESIVEVAKEIRGVAGERPLAGDEFVSIMRSQTLRLPGRFETLASLEGAAIQMINYGLSPDYFTHYARNVRALTEEDLAAAGTRYVRPDEIVWLVIGDMSKVESGIRELGLGEVVRLTVEGEVLP